MGQAEECVLLKYHYVMDFYLKGTIHPKIKTQSLLITSMLFESQVKCLSP